MSQMTNITILIVNHHSIDFVKVSLRALFELTKNKFLVKILDNSVGEKEYTALLKLTKNNTNVEVIRMESKKSGSQSHAEALDSLVKKVKTRYFSVLDADAIWLKKNWDEILINRLGQKTKIIGSQAPPPKPQDFPLMFASVFETKSFRKLHISFKPKEIGRYQDTGHEMRSKYLSAGLKGENLSVKNTRYFHKGKFNDLICAEYYIKIKGKVELIASHFGRGSSLGMAKYLDFNRSPFYRIPVVKNLLAKRKGIIEKNKWIQKCNDIIEDQKIPANIIFENASCDYCRSMKTKAILKSRDFLNQRHGIFQIVKCKKCGLIFTNPRPQEASIKYYYPKTVGYYIPETPKEKRGIKKIINDFVLWLYFDYPYIVLPIFVKRIFQFILFPALFYPISYLKYYGTPDYIENGSLLDVGCSYGRYLLEMKRLGFKCQGIEMDKTSAKWGEREFGVKITSDNFINFSNRKKFDIVTMRMFLEHSFSPMKVLSKANKILKSDGQLIITVPDYNGIEQLLYGEYGYNLHLPAHLYHFTEESILKYLIKNNFDKIKIYHSFLDRDLIAPLTFMAKNGKNTYLLKKIFTNKFFRLLFVKPFIITVGIFGKTGRMTIYCRKK
jgi:2-polyprenyl-3-methyl-5-hydroxy-6-metoxy-1,4-benzoquinol methylase